MFLTSNNQYDKKTLVNICREHGIEIEPFSGKYSFGISLNFLSDKIPIAANILKSITLNQNFNQDDFLIEQKNAIFSLKQQSESGWYHSSLHFKKDFFANTLFEKPTEGTEESLEQVTTHHLENLKQHFFIPSNMVLSIYGDVTKKDIKKHFFDWLSTMPTKSLPQISSISLAPLPSSIASTPAAGNYFGQVKTFYMKGSKQSFFRLGYRAPKN